MKKGIKQRQKQSKTQLACVAIQLVWVVGASGHLISEAKEKLLSIGKPINLLSTVLCENQQILSRK